MTDRTAPKADVPKTHGLERHSRNQGCREEMTGMASHDALEPGAGARSERDHDGDDHDHEYDEGQEQSRVHCRSLDADRRCQNGVIPRRRRRAWQGGTRFGTTPPWARGGHRDERRPGQGQVLAGADLPYQRLSLPKNCIDSAATLELSRQLDAVTVLMPVIE